MSNFEREQIKKRAFNEPSIVVLESFSADIAEQN
jgi:hypothetical protein